jgi:hypothetical protein
LSDDTDTKLDVVVLKIVVVFEVAVMFEIVVVFGVAVTFEIVVVAAADAFDVVNTPLLPSAIMATQPTVISELIVIITNRRHRAAAGCIILFY